MIHNLPSNEEIPVRPRRYDPSRQPADWEQTMSTAAHDESQDRIDDMLNVQLARLRPEADRLHAALLRGESPESLGLTEDGLAQVREERGIA